MSRRILRAAMAECDARGGAAAVPGIAVIDLRSEGEDITIDLPILKRPGAQRTLYFIADRGGEVGWDWNGGIDPKTNLWKPLSHETRELITDLINAEILREREYVAGNAVAKLTLFLTDKGRNLVAKMRAHKIVGTEARPLTVDEMRELAKIE